MQVRTFLGLECIEITNGALSLLVTRSVGPRILALFTQNGENLFAELPEHTLDCPGRGAYFLYGGHRLWLAPEEPGRTYLPDDDPVHIEEIDSGLQVTQKFDQVTGIQKVLRIRLEKNQPVVKVEHSLTNLSASEVTCAPWAITQMKTGGVAILPQYNGLIEGNPTLPNRTVTLWPYTDTNNPAIIWGNDTILVRANMQDGALKIGFPNPRGWMAYWQRNTLFIKRAVYNNQAAYFDSGSSSECYCNPDFLELETLGPISTIQPGDSISHKETWRVYSGISWPENTQEITDRIENEAAGS
ncbi:MAG: hypothetical protein JXA25_10525 [Anaerolineales bacterium]|nr:hypothetical protein [Anaerolineales bacterium]